MKKLVAIAVVGLFGLSAAGLAQARTEQYRASLDAEQEVADPPVVSDAGGDFKLKVAHDGQSARFDLKISPALDNTTMAHIHIGAAGTNGPVVVWLYPDGPPPQLIEGSFEGRLSKDVITEASLVGELAGDWDGFLAALDAGDLYVNVHTNQFPAGEIRGQIGSHPG